MPPKMFGDKICKIYNTLGEIFYWLGERIHLKNLRDKKFLFFSRVGGKIKVMGFSYLPTDFFGEKSFFLSRLQSGYFFPSRGRKNDFSSEKVGEVGKNHYFFLKFTLPLFSPWFFFFFFALILPWFFFNFFSCGFTFFFALASPWFFL